MTLLMENLGHFMDRPIQPAIDVIRMNAKNLSEFRLSGFLGRPEKGYHFPVCFLRKHDDGLRRREKRSGLRFQFR